MTVDNLEMPPCYEQQRMVVNKLAEPPGVSRKHRKDRKRTKGKQPTSYNGPQCFVIPGNHGWSSFLASTSSKLLFFFF